MHNLQDDHVNAYNLLIKWVTCKFSKEKNLYWQFWKMMMEEFVLFQNMKWLNFNLDFLIHPDPKHPSLCLLFWVMHMHISASMLTSNVILNYSNSGAYLSFRIAIKMTLIVVSVLISTKLLDKWKKWQLITFIENYRGKITFYVGFFWNFLKMYFVDYHTCPRVISVVMPWGMSFCSTMFTTTTVFLFIRYW